MSKVPEVKRVLSNFQNILDGLIAFSNEFGVTDEEFNKGIHRLTTPEGEEDLKKIATLIFKKEKELSSANTVICNHNFLTNRLGSGWNEEDHRCCCEKEVRLEKHPDGLYLNDTKVERYLSPNQQDGNNIEGNKLRKELAGKPVLCACVLDYLLEHPKLIPEEWKSGCTFFWETIFRDPIGDLCVACLYWDGGQWGWDNGWLDGGWHGRDSAAVSASIT